MCKSADDPQTASIETVCERTKKGNSQCLKYMITQDICWWFFLSSDMWKNVAANRSKAQTWTHQSPPHINGESNMLQGKSGSYGVVKLIGSFVQYKNASADGNRHNHIDSKRAQTIWIKFVKVAAWKCWERIFFLFFFNRVDCILTVWLWCCATFCLSCLCWVHFCSTSRTSGVRDLSSSPRRRVTKMADSSQLRVCFDVRR